MSRNLELYARIAGVFDPPGADFVREVRRISADLRGSFPSAADAVDRFAALLPEDQVARAELFVRTFDVQAITTLDLGYVLFGEDYKRGALLAGLANEHTKARNYCGAELADHLPNVLRLLPKLGPGEVQDELVSVILGPAVRDMLREFEPARMAKKEAIYKKHHKTIIEHAVDVELRTAYRHTFEALYEMLRADFNLKVSLPVEQADTFDQSIDTEMGIEGCGPCAAGA